MAGPHSGATLWADRYESGGSYYYRLVWRPTGARADKPVKVYLGSEKKFERSDIETLTELLAFVRRAKGGLGREDVCVEATLAARDLSRARQGARNAPGPESSANLSVAVEQAVQLLAGRYGVPVDSQLRALLAG